MRHILDPAQFHGEAEFGIGYPDFRRIGIGYRHYYQPPIDFLAPVHPRCVFLPDIAALGEGHAVQFGGIAFQPEQIGQLGVALGHAQ